jgi:hypothetical protein
MTQSEQLTAFLANFKTRRSLRRICAVGLLAAVTGVPITAAGARDRAGAYNGVWNVQFETQKGNCSSTNSVPFTVAGRSVSSAGGGKVTGGIRPGGRVVVQISVGASKASGSGRLAGNSGTGTWSGIISGDRCSGSWQATRT